MMTASRPRDLQTMIIAASSLLICFARYICASPILPRQAVTALISPPQPPPPVCTGSFPSLFGIAVMNISLSSPASSPSQTLQRRQPPPLPIFTVGMLNQINDGQVQGGMHTDSISIVADPPTSTSIPVATMVSVTQIGDGQIQAPAVTSVPDVQFRETTTTTATMTATATTCSSSNSISTTPSPFPQLTGVSPLPSKPPTVIEQACGISTRASVNLPSSFSFPVQASTAPASPSSSLTSTFLATSTSSFPISTTTSPSSASTQHPSPSQRLSFVSCLTNSTLRLHLQNNNLYDALNRTGYIASNYQFQFDAPPQSGAIWTSGWSVCPVDSDTAELEVAAHDDGGKSANGDGDGDSDAAAPQGVEADLSSGIAILALGGTTTFWQCLSGEFYNLYTENWAAQCSPVELQVVRLVDC